MKKIIRKFQRSGTQIALAVLLVFIGLILQIAPARQALDNLTYDLIENLGGTSAMSPDFLMISIGEEDIQTLGGWPLSRDYYGLLLHGLTSMGADVVAIDLLLDSPSAAHPERDRQLAEFMETGPPVVLSMVFSKFSTGVAEIPVMPLDIFRNVSSQGFSNFHEAGKLRRAPVSTSAEDSTYLSLGAEMARIALGAHIQAYVERSILYFFDGRRIIRKIFIDRDGCMLLPGSPSLTSLRQMGLLEALQLIADSTSALDLHGVKVIVAATAPGLPVLLQSASGETVPAAFIHAMAAQTILDQKWLRQIPAFFALLVWILIVMLTLQLMRIKQFGFRMLSMTGLVLVILLLSWLIKIIFGIVLPMADGVAAVILTLVAAVIIEQKKIQKHWFVKSEAYRQRLAGSRDALAMAEAEFMAMSAGTDAQSDELARSRRHIARLEKQVRDIESYTSSSTLSGRSYGGLIHAAGSPLEKVLKLIDTVAAGDLPIIIQGETGTGKELVARAIHRNSERMHAPFVAINCGALSENLLESELFGHEKGAFTGAHMRRKGRFELADGGTLFLDEITETAPAFQARLLRVLQEGAFERVGGEKTIRCSVRIVAATNRDIKRDVEESSFRADLYYRLNGMTLTLPPLRDRHGDLPVLIEHFLKEHAGPSVDGVSTAAMEQMDYYAWPGNIRELENAIRRAIMVAKGHSRRLIQVSDLPPEMAEISAEVHAAYQPLEDQVLNSLRSFDFSRSAISQTAKLLGDRDRGTITEYFRGLCFESFVDNDFNQADAVKQLADSTDAEVLQKLNVKFESYLDNLKKSLENSDRDMVSRDRLHSAFKGLPKKYHAALEAVIIHLDRD
ncbi:sigma 54-interacting transcriptional regulator [bacterium]|nr:sigma 54-interacting transcriptional regulator [bacterium]